MLHEHRTNITVGHNLNNHLLIARLDIDFLSGGLGRRIMEWPYNVTFASDVYFRIYLPVRGEFMIQSSSESQAVSPGNIYMVPPDMPINFCGISPCTHYWIHFISRHLHSIAAFQQLITVELSDVNQTRREVSTLMHHIKSSDDTILSMIDIKYRLEKLVAIFIDKVYNNSVGHSVDYNNPFQKVLNYIDYNLSRDIKVSELAKLMKMSQLSFSAAFRKYLGISPKQFITNRRLSNAKHLLLQTNLRVKEIARLCGYQDEFFFSRIFKQHTQHSPKTFRHKRGL